MYHPYITGKKIYLRGLEPQDVKGLWAQWANDSEVTHYMFMGSRPNSAEGMQAEYESIVRSPNDIVFAICDKKTDKHIGNAGLYVINWISRASEYRIIIGEKNFWNKGIGEEAANLIIEYGFNKLNLNKIWLGVNADNKAGARCYEKSGFKREGVLRQEIYRNGRYYDAVRMSLLRKEYEAQKGK